MVCANPILLVAVATLALETSKAQTAGLRQQGFNETIPGLIERPVLEPPKKSLSNEMRGDIFMARKMFREAVDMYSSMPDSAVKWNKVGIAYHQMLDLKTAKKYYERAIKLDHQYSEAVNNLGTVHYARKSYRRAISCYKKALKIRPQSASVLSNLGTAYFARKKYEDALEAYQQALAIDPEVFEHRNSAGVLLQERSVEERAKFHFYLAKTYAKAGAHDRALLYLRKALEEGFRDRHKMTEDPEFAMMQEIPEFQELLRFEPKIL